MAANEVLFVLISEFADWEGAALAAGLNWGFGMLPGNYRVKTLGVADAPVRSLGGFTVAPDYTPDTAPDDFAGLVLIGGNHWFSPEAEAVLPLVRKAFDRQKVVAAICDATVWLGAHGFLNHADHTGGDPAHFREKAGAVYTGAARYRALPSVRDGKLVTANVAGFLEFMRDVMLALEAGPPENIDMLYRTFKSGMYREPPASTGGGSQSSTLL